LGTYVIDAVFSSPGAQTFSLGLTLTVFDGCATSTFPSAPVLSPASFTYLIGQGD